jgi:hypothetical protein
MKNDPHWLGRGGIALRVGVGVAVPRDFPFLLIKRLTVQAGDRFHCARSRPSRRDGDPGRESRPMLRILLAIELERVGSTIFGQRDGNAVVTVGRDIDLGEGQLDFRRFPRPLETALAGNALPCFPRWRRLLHSLFGRLRST